VIGADFAATEARIRAFEGRTGVEVVAAVVDRSDRYHGLRWRAFAAGTSLAGLAVVVADVLRPDWTGAHAALVTAVTVLAAGLGALWSRLFRGPSSACSSNASAPRPRRASAPRRSSSSATSSRHRTDPRCCSSQAGNERVAVVVGDRGYDGRISAAEWESVVAAMTRPFSDGGRHCRVRRGP
jgi:uncharacterized membrane protein